MVDGSAAGGFPYRCCHQVPIHLDAYHGCLRDRCSSVPIKRVRLGLPGILTGTILAFARALGEFGATITFVSNIPGETQTIPLAMFSFIETPGAENEAARLCVIAIVIALMSLMISEWLTRIARKRLEA